MKIEVKYKYSITPELVAATNVDLIQHCIDESIEKFKRSHRFPDDIQLQVKMDTTTGLYEGHYDLTVQVSTPIYGITFTQQQALIQMTKRSVIETTNYNGVICLKTPMGSALLQRDHTPYLPYNMLKWLRAMWDQAYQTNL